LHVRVTLLTVRPFLRSSTLASAAVALALLPRCSSESPPAPQGTRAFDSGDSKLVVDLDAGTLVLSYKGATRVTLPKDALALGALDAVKDDANYDPYWLYVENALNRPPDSLRWLVPERIEPLDAGSFTLRYPENASAVLRVTTGALPGAFKLSLTDVQGPVAYLRLRTRSDATEGFYGLGEFFDDVNQRGKIRAMQIELDGELESSYNEAHAPIPLLLGTRGWGLFVNTLRPGAFAVANEEADRVDAAFGTGVATKAEGLTFHLFAEAHPLDLTKHYHAVTGKPRLPARWALGPWFWRNDTTGQDEVMADAKALRDNDLATTGLWIDRPYASAVQTFDFDGTKYYDGKTMMEKVHGLGLRVAIWHVPYLDEKDPATQVLRDRATSEGFYPKEHGPNFNKWGVPIDLANKKAYEWWQALVSTYTVLGKVEGFKLDYAEDIVPGLTAARNKWVFGDGSDERTMHAGYTLLYHKLYADLLPKDGGFLLCRHANVGDQVNGPILWPGDLDADFSKHRDKVKDSSGKSYTAVGGLPASVIAGLTLGPSGFPFYGSDTGGYRHGPPKKELFTRWFEQTALSSVMQVGNADSTVPWVADPKTGFDAEMLGWYRTYARLHLRLFPYEWSYAQKLLVDGRPIQRPLGLAYPELGAHPNDTYMFGDHLLVAPVVTEGQRTRAVSFPKGAGRFYDYWTGEPHDDGSTATVAAPLETLPLFLVEGGIVPLLRPTIDAMAPTTEPTLVDSYATTPGLLWVRIAPGPGRVFELFDGARVEHSTADGALTVKLKDGAEFKNGFVIELIARPKPTSVSGLTEVADLAALEAATSGWTWTKDVGGTITIKIPTGTSVVVK